MQDYELMGRDWGLVYRSPPHGICQVCGHPVRLIVSFKPGTSLRICGGCRGY